MSNKDEFGIKSEDPCRVCGKHKNNQTEPRFLYTVCEDHQNVAPRNLPSLNKKPPAKIKKTN